MYRAGLVAVIVANGKIVREMNSGGTSTVYLPFGCEYSIRLKNNESRRAAVRISVDGSDVMSGHQLVVEANSESEVKGKLDASGNEAKNAFRFIQKTQKISDHRGDRIDDGIVRIEFQFEEPPYIPPYTPPLRPLKKARPYPSPSPIWYESGLGAMRGCADDGQISCNSVQTQGFACQTKGMIEPGNDNGITVAGSHVNQRFGSTYLGRLEATKHVIVFELRGAKSDGQPIVQPVLSRKPVECPTCGKSCKSSAKFCSECSTCLV